MAQHRPSKPAPVEYSTDEEDMIVYDVDEDAIESNPDYPAATTTGLGASPSRVTTGDELIAEKSDLFREAIRARNVYAAWARKLTNARPNDPKLQEFHQEVTKAGESVNSLLTQLDVPLFRIPASEKELDKILLRLKNKPVDPPAVKNQEAK
ncbi:hypothetical protein TNCV_1137061 [Trichonephila clavipes]|nr:hypothetical protein TNCV_1137061 [Trichonephila clavipes]